MLIGLDAMPGRWEVMDTDNDSGILPYDGAESYAAIFFKELNSNVYAISLEIVYRNRNENWAARNYQRVSEGIGCGDNQIPNHISAWRKPEEFTFAPAAADQWCFGCAPSRLRDARLCKYQARYEEFVVSVVVPLEVEGEQLLTIPEIETIVRAIDERMGEKLR